jgi:hypothetical protein
LIFGSGLISEIVGDVDDEDAIDYIFGRGRLTLDDASNLKVPKPEPLDLDERDRWFMYRTRVLEGGLPLVPAVPVLWGPLVESGEVDGRGGLDVDVVDVVEFVEDMAEVLVGSFLEEVVSDMVGEIAFDVCVEEDATSVWEYLGREMA